MANTMFALGIYTYDDDEIDQKSKKQKEPESFKIFFKETCLESKAEGHKSLSMTKIKKKTSSYDSNRENFLNVRPKLSFHSLNSKTEDPEDSMSKSGQIKSKNLKVSSTNQIV